MAGSSAGQNLDHIISSLKETLEEIKVLQGMFSTIKKWAHITGSARNKIDSALYELTGDAFYKLKEEHKRP